VIIENRPDVRLTVAPTLARTFLGELTNSHLVNATFRRPGGCG
jgi:hypothetical protein